MPTDHLPPAHRSLIASIAANTRWSRVNSMEARRKATDAARTGRRRQWELQVDPEGVLTPEELHLAVERRAKAHQALMTLRSAQARAARRAANG